MCPKEHRPKRRQKCTARPCGFTTCAEVRSPFRAERVWSFGACGFTTYAEVRLLVSFASARYVACVGSPANAMP